MTEQEQPADDGAELPITPNTEVEDLQAIIIHLLRNKGVFYANLLTQMRRIETDKLPAAAGVAVVNGRIELYWNSKYLREKTKNIKERVAILEHECKHLIYNHIARESGRDHKLWNIATDLTINQGIDNLPPWVITPKAIEEQLGVKVPKGKASEYYYSMLKENADKMEFSDNGDGSTHVTIKDKDGNVKGEFDIESPGVHDKWEESSKDGEMTEEVIKQAVRKAVETTERHAGTVPGDIQDLINELFKPPVIPWWSIVRKWVGTRVRSGNKYSLKRPNRRYGQFQKGKIPVRKLNVAFVIDTSGSVRDEELQEFITEMKAIMSSYKSTVTVIECDYVVQKVYQLTPHKKIDGNFKGRGGTSFRPPFEHIEKNKLPIDMLIYFTDLEGDFPDKKPPYPVLWVATNGTPQWGGKPPFGDILDLKEHRKDQA